MDVSYRRDKDHNYMILDAPGELTGEEYQVRMLVGNQIPHLLKCNRRMMDGKAVFFYEITGMQPMFRVFEKRQINQEDMIEILQDIKEALENTERYLLDGNQLLFEPEYLFFHAQSRQWNLCYLPTYDGNITDSFRSLSEYLLKRLDHSDEQAVMLGYEVYSRASEENYRISEVLQIIYQVRAKNNKKEDTAEKESSLEDTSAFDFSDQEEPYFEEESEYTVSEENRPLEQPIREEKEPRKTDRKQTDFFGKSAEKLTEKRTREKTKKAGKYIAAILIGSAVIAAAVLLAIFGMINQIQAGGILFLAIGILIYMLGVSPEDSGKNKKKKAQPFEDFSEEMETCILQEGKDIRMAILVSLKPEEYVNILLYREETRIGKEERQADVCIDRDVISRVHAKILRKEEEYFLMDLDSTNGTYLNGKRITGDNMEKLQQGDRISFADLEYIFQLQ